MEEVVGGVSAGDCGGLVAVERVRDRASRGAGRRGGGAGLEQVRGGGVNFGIATRGESSRIMMSSSY